MSNYELFSNYEKAGMTTATHSTFQRKRTDIGIELFSNAEKARDIVEMVFNNIAELPYTRKGAVTVDTIVGVPFTVNVSPADRAKRKYLPENGEYLLPLRSQVVADLLMNRPRSFVNARGEFMNLCVKMQTERLQDCSVILHELNISNWGEFLHRLGDLLIAENDSDNVTVEKATIAYCGRLCKLKQGYMGRTHGGKIRVYAKDLRK